jgi:hypothetical protein
MLEVFVSVDADGSVVGLGWARREVSRLDEIVRDGDRQVLPQRCKACAPRRHPLARVPVARSDFAARKHGVRRLTRISSSARPYAPHLPAHHGHCKVGRRQERVFARFRPRVSRCLHGGVTWL